jgi:hypothetical protein
MQPQLARIVGIGLQSNQMNSSSSLALPCLDDVLIIGATIGTAFSSESRRRCSMQLINLELWSCVQYFVDQRIRIYRIPNEYEASWNEDCGSRRASFRRSRFKTQKREAWDCMVDGRWSSLKSNHSVGEYWYCMQ